jgi:hypothetical protein
VRCRAALVVLAGLLHVRAQSCRVSHCLLEDCACCAPARGRAKVLFDIGMNVGRLLSLPAGVGMLGRAMLQLLVEYEYHSSGDGALADLVRPPSPPPPPHSVEFPSPALLRPLCGHVSLCGAVRQLHVVWCVMCGPAWLMYVCVCGVWAWWRRRRN